MIMKDKIILKQNDDNNYILYIDGDMLIEKYSAPAHDEDDAMWIKEIPLNEAVNSYEKEIRELEDKIEMIKNADLNLSVDELGLDFLFKTTDISEIKTFLDKCKELKFLGTKIAIGTYLPDAYDMDYIYKTEFLVDQFEIGGVTINIDNENNEIRLEKFPDQYGIDNIMVGLSTDYDIEEGDVPDKSTNSLEKALKALDNYEKI